MTSHQVNLYQAQFRPRRQVLSFEQILAGWVVLMLFGLASGVASVYVSQLRAGELLLAQQRSEMLDQSILALTEQVEQRASNDALVNANEVIRLRIRKSDELVRFLDSRRVSFDGAGRLSGVMMALARQAGEGLWLDAIRLADTGLTLSGFVDTPSRLPAYLRRLGGEPTLEGRQFDNLRVTAVTAGADSRLAFQLSTVAGDAVPEVAER
ncbi:MAG: PilN domain-containing protein [Pseudomonadota bacterium]